MKKQFLTVFIALIAALMLAAPAQAAPADKTVILATTTSTQDTGLLDELLPIFEKQTGYFVKTIAVGSGQAMAMGERGEADVLLVHSPDAEKKFMEAGNGINRKLIMHNDFIILGPAADPAKVKSAKTAKDANETDCRQRIFVPFPAVTTPARMPRKRASGKRQVLIPRARNGISRPDSVWDRRSTSRRKRTAIRSATGAPTFH